jgi:type I restriction enzyme R subunit
LKEGEPRLFHSNLMVVRSSGTLADYGTITSEEEHFYRLEDAVPAGRRGAGRHERAAAVGGRAC